ncbi:MAG: caspase domain-containing protein [Candidatus Sulfotelmatobacter sp.]
MRKALVVGINDYPGAPLHGCINDANAIASVLATHGDGGPNFSVRLLTAPGETIGRAELRGAIEKLFAGDCDICLFYFSGHGFIKSTGGYIVTQDAKKYDEGVSMDDLLALANQSKAKDKVILLDCCHSGALGTPTITGSNAALLSEGLSVLTASRDSESALEIDGKGVFTSLIVDALQGGAADLRGYVTPGSIYAYVDQALGPWDQRPIFKTNVTRFTSLRSIAPPVAFETLRKICSYFPTPQDEHKLDPSYEFTEKERANPANVAIMKDLQKFVGVGLVVPVGEEHMYFAAMNSKSCRLTALGYQYWRLVKEKRL